MNIKSLLTSILFGSRRIQLPLYLWLILVQMVYVWFFWIEVAHLLDFVWLGSMTETQVILIVLGLIDVVMISNLLVMVIVWGYETFVSRMGLQGHPDQPEWLWHMNSWLLKTKLAMSIVGISSVHLLRTFVDVAHYDVKSLVAQWAIHIVFILSAIAIAYINKITVPIDDKSID